MSAEVRNTCQKSIIGDYIRSHLAVLTLSVRRTNDRGPLRWRSAGLTKFAPTGDVGYAKLTVASSLLAHSIFNWLSNRGII
jgi:hypothetical protein